MSVRGRVAALAVLVGLLAAASAPATGPSLAPPETAASAAASSGGAQDPIPSPEGPAPQGGADALAPANVSLPLQVALWADPDPGDVLAAAPTPTPRPTPDLTPSQPFAVRSVAPLVTHGPRGRPAVAITVDDGQSAAAIEAILSVFLDLGVNATWFPIGSIATLHPATWRRIADLGFEIGNHTWSHVDLTRLSRAAIEMEIVRGRAAIQQATGRAVAPFVRPPGGAWSRTVLAAAGQTGQASVVNWDVTSGDTGRGPVEEVVANATRGGAGTILLFHANDRSDDLRTARALPLVIEWYRARGFELVTLGQLLSVTGPVPFPAA